MLNSGTHMLHARCLQVSDFDRRLGLLFKWIFFFFLQKNLCVSEICKMGTGLVSIPLD
jgi:hypothetical protein